jgi:hypothetical protein
MIRRPLLLYPRDWRARYGDELATLLDDPRFMPPALFGLVFAALSRSGDSLTDAKD